MRLACGFSPTTASWKDEARAYLPKSERRENGGRGVSYRLQMLLKLGVARHVKTEYYRTLDNDMFLKRPTTASDLAPYNVALVQGREPNRHRASWWTSAASILRSGKQCGLNLKTDAFQIGVTPAVLRTSLTRELLSFVEAMHPPSPEEGGQPNNYARALFRLL
ncbi:hypothetical protein DIPPA_19592 [Diplonema papillatum]|nr:hypothetical protein DIPPA_19592 [Diplonema papillatum]